MDEIACTEALEGLNAYYKVACNTFIDNVCRQVIERHLLRNLPDIFLPQRIAGLGDEELQTRSPYTHVCTSTQLHPQSTIKMGAPQAKPENGDGLSTLRSNKTVRPLEPISSLRARGVGENINLPRCWR